MNSRLGGVNPQGWSHRIAVVGLWVAATIGTVLVAYAILSLLGVVPSLTAPTHGLSGADLASLAVAGATLLLAAFTAQLALATNAALQLARRETSVAERALATAQSQTAKVAEQVEATNRQGALAERALESSWRPMLVDVPSGMAKREIPPFLAMDAAEVNVYKAPESGLRLVAVSLRNIGSGPAFVSKASLSMGAVGAQMTDASSLVIARDEIAHVEFRFDPSATPELAAVAGGLDNDQPCRVNVEYSDLGGHQWRSWAHLRRYRAWIVDKVELFDGDALKPFASTGSAGP